MKRIGYLLSVFGLILAGNLTAQNTFIKAYSIDSLPNTVHNILDIRKFNGTYYMYGTGVPPNTNNSDLFIAKLDCDFNIKQYNYIKVGEWLATYFDPNSQAEITFIDSSHFTVNASVIPTNDVITFCIDTGLQLGWKYKLTLAGDYGGYQSKNMLLVDSTLYQTFTGNSLAHDYWNTKIIKSDLRGNILLEKDLYGYFASHLIYDTLLHHFKIFGITFDIDTASFSKGKVQILDKNLNVLSTITKYRDREYFFNVMEHMEGSSDLITDSYNILPPVPYSPFVNVPVFSLFVARRDSNLNLLWREQIWPGTYSFNSVTPIKRSTDGNYFVLARAICYAEDIADRNAISDSVPLYMNLLVKFDGSGKILWRRLDTLGLYKPTNYAESRSFGLFSTEDGGAMCTGTVDTAYIIDGLRRYTSIGYVLKVDADGCISGSHCGSVPLKTSVEVARGRLSVYPTLNNGSFTILYPDELTDYENLSVKIFNLAGILCYNQPVKQNSLSDMEVHFSAPARGVYFVHLIQNNQIIAVEKIIVQQ